MFRFGKDFLSYEDKIKAVNEVFRKVSEKYDLMNDAMSLGMHRLWKRHFVSKIAAYDPSQILEVASGTCDITAFLHQALPHANIIASDINPDMLEKGRLRLIDQGIFDRIDFVECGAEKLLQSDQQCDAYVISFGLRNVTDIPQALREAYRVLKYQGRFFCMEFHPLADEGVFSQIYSLYGEKIIPQLGEWLANDRFSYQYFVDSITTFHSPQELKNMLRDAGFTYVFQKPLCGGVVHIHEAIKV